jgi:AraC-like DNA-binding protein
MKDTQQTAILELRQVLSQKIIPRISSPESLRMILAQRPLRLPPDVTVKRRPAPSLKINRNNRSNLFLSKYPEEGVHAIRYPYLCYVVDGEIDMRLGLAAERGKTRGVVNRYEILTLPAHSALLIPPGVFFPDENHSGASADARMFWVHILPSGVFCHTSTARNDAYVMDHLDVFVPGRSFAVSIDLLEEDLRSADKEAVMVTRSILLSFFSRIFWKLSEGTQASVASSVEGSEREDVPPGDNSLIIQRACEFIRKHNGIAFTVEEVAAYAYVSSSHLMRLFRSELQTTVMDYVLQQRFAVAEAWLKNSEMPIKQIASALGYSHAPQFNRIFKQIYGISPTEFRRRGRV